MRKMKTEQLTGIALDWAVANCEAMLDGTDEDIRGLMRVYNPSSDWDDGGPIIDRERINLLCRKQPSDPTRSRWSAYMYRFSHHMGENDSSITNLDGPTPLIAAMRCYVFTHFGAEIDIPEEFTDENAH
jgi:hypothetical protein